MTIRELPQAEYPKLMGTEMGDIWPHLNPDHTRVFVVEADGQIVGCWSLTTCVHAEGLWIHPDHRGRGAVGRKLYTTVIREARDTGARSLLTQAVDPLVATLVEKSGGRVVPGSLCVMPVGGA